MVSKIVTTTSMAIRNRRRVRARLESRTDLNFAHVRSVMKSVRRIARKQVLEPSQSLPEHTTYAPTSMSSKPVLRVETNPSHSEYPEMNPYATENERCGVSTPVSKGATDQCHSVKRNRQSQRSQRPQLSDIALRRALEEQAGETLDSALEDSAPRSACLYGDYSYIYDMYLEEPE